MIRQFELLPDTSPNNTSLSLAPVLLMSLSNTALAKYTLLPINFSSPIPQWVKYGLGYFYLREGKLTGRHSELWWSSDHLNVAFTIAAFLKWWPICHKQATRAFRFKEAIGKLLTVVSSEELLYLRVSLLDPGRIHKGE